MYVSVYCVMCHVHLSAMILEQRKAQCFVRHRSRSQHTVSIHSAFSDDVDTIGLQDDDVDTIGLQDDDVHTIGLQDDDVDTIGLQYDDVDTTGLQYDAGGG